MKPIQNVVQANPGFYVTEPVTDENDMVVEAVLIPVIAWAFINHNPGEPEPIITVAPVTPNGVEHQGEVAVLEEKTGRLFTFIAEYSSIQDWIDSQNEQTRKRSRLDRIIKSKSLENKANTGKEKAGDLCR